MIQGKEITMMILDEFAEIDKPRLVKRTVIHKAPWFLLFGGTSEDGRGQGTFKGRTDSPATALTFYREHIKKAGPYATGAVQAVTDDKLTNVDEKWLKAENDRQEKIRYPKAKKLNDPTSKPTDYGTFA